MSEQTFIVEGMSCKNCKAHVERGIKTIPGIEEVEADHVSGQVKVSGSQLSEELIKTAVEKAGYRFRGLSQL